MPRCYSLRGVSLEERFGHSHLLVLLVSGDWYDIIRVILTLKLSPMLWAPVCYPSLSRFISWPTWLWNIHLLDSLEGYSILLAIRSLAFSVNSFWYSGLVSQTHTIPIGKQGRPSQFCETSVSIIVHVEQITVIKYCTEERYPAV